MESPQKHHALENRQRNGGLPSTQAEEPPRAAKHETAAGGCCATRRALPWAKLLAENLDMASAILRVYPASALALGTLLLLCFK